MDSTAPQQQQLGQQTGLKIRYSVRELWDEFNNGNPQPLEDLVRAWKGILELDPSNPLSFFVIGGYHGEPFVGQGETDPAYWGGYCNHGNVLFPTWHRMYVQRIEEALQSIVPGVTMPYWDETSQESIEKGVPAVLTDETFTFSDGTEIPNPLQSYTLQKAVNDNVTGDDQRYTKPAGYATVRYPLSGLVGTAEARAETETHNAQYQDPVQRTTMLNNNYKAWLYKRVEPEDELSAAAGPEGILAKFRDCLDAPNYTAFSNTTSAQHWNVNNPGIVTPVESPHNEVHLAVGGFDVDGHEFGLVKGANGDMGENNTAGLDPIFFFHHCNVDRMFWLWQVKNGHTDSIDIIKGDPGTNPNTLAQGGQGPAAGQDPTMPLNMDTPLKPFLKDPSDPQSYYTSRDVVNLETQLGVTYSPGSLAGEQGLTESMLRKMTPGAKKLHVFGIDRQLFPGSFIINAFMHIDGKRVFLGRQTILSRWNVSYCPNCQHHLMTSAFFDLSGFTLEQLKEADFEITFQHRGEAMPQNLNYHVEVID
ncbi:tyrosinase family protein [Pontibacter sp. G13]|uniref:tyrosinase family protein n=1 Tax=Pontibacter sp. G13 TaxID=3074898 RepID=UPI00288A7A28|nr:tyrosinase family protein [Pontibacter sp. G13]WNJ17185.1 tyrosinase family protein [Pontibacter sp. G13]